MFTRGVTKEEGNDGRKNKAFTAQKRKFSIKNFFGKYEQIRSKLRICSHLLKKYLE